MTSRAQCVKCKKNSDTSAGTNAHTHIHTGKLIDFPVETCYIRYPTLKVKVKVCN